MGCRELSPFDLILEATIAYLCADNIHVSGEVYHVNRSYLSKEALVFLESIGVTKAQIDEGKIELDDIPDEKREVARSLFVASGVEKDQVPSGAAMMKSSCRALSNYSKFFASIDGNSKELSPDEFAIIPHFINPRAAPEELRSQMDKAIAFVKKFNIRDTGDVRKVLRLYSDFGPEKAQAVLHYFVDPKRYPAPKNFDGLKRGETPSGECVKLQKNVRADVSALPDAVKSAGEAVSPVNVVISTSSFDVESGGTMFCVGSVKSDKTEYAIFATNAHVLIGSKEYPRRRVAPDVDLIAVPITTGSEMPKHIEIGGVHKKGFVYTINRNGEFKIGSDVEYLKPTHVKQGNMEFFTEAGEMMVYRGLNVRGDSGSPILNASGQLVGVLQGTRGLACYAFADMKKFKEVLKSFKEELSGDEMASD